MAFTAAFLPYLTAAVSAAGAGVSIAQKYNADQYNSKVLANEQGAAVNQANAAANLQQRAGRQALGRQAAAFGSGNVGYGGSSETALDQSAVNSELDALNIKYKGAMSGYGYGVQSGIDASQGNQEAAGGGLLAGAALLKGATPNYSFMPETPAQMAGLSIND